MEMGEKIKLLREQNDMTLEQLGNKVGVGKSTVRKWENGMIANMRRDKIAKLADALHCSPGYLMGWDDNLTQDNAAFTADLLLDPQLMEHTKKLRDLTPEHKQTVYDTIDFLYEKEK